MNFQKYIYLFLLLGFQVLAFAQTADPLAQAQHEIWTETALFVYRDAKMAEPASISEAANLSQLVAAIKKEDSKSQIYSKVYKPIEETGTYKSGKDLKTKLNLLITSIQRKLRENEQRMNNIDRRRRLDDMINQLQQIASDYTLPTPSATAVAPAGNTTDSAETSQNDLNSTAISSQTVPDSAAENLAENQLSSLSKKQNKAKNIDWMSTIALILGVINLGLIYMLFKGIGNANTRLDQRKKEIETLTTQLNNLERKSGGGPDRSSKINPAEVENLVQKTLAREMAKYKKTTDSGRENPAGQLVASSDERPIKMAQPAKPIAETPEQVTSEVSPPPMAPVPPPPAKPQSYFARVPVNGGFHEQDLYASQQHDSIYEIRLSKNDSTKAGFRIVLNSAVHRTAIESAYLSLKDACNYQLNNQHATTIITDKPGSLVLENGFWKIEKKAEIHFE